MADLEVKAQKARSKDYSADIAKVQARLDNLSVIPKFTYNPNGENIGKNSLDHAQVISMGADFISEKETMQKVLVSKFPILLIDESQDTKKELVDALLKIESIYTGSLTIGMFGDMMQRIYADGKEGLESSIPKDWERPDKAMNHRSNKRIIHLANSVRASIDGREQQARSDKPDGFVRLFVVPNGVNKANTEESIYRQMATLSSDEKWLNPDDRKTLVLEHSMAASRIGFERLSDALSKEFSQSFRDGSLPELNFLMTIVDPLIRAIQSDDDFTLMKLLRKHSPMLNADSYRGFPNQKQALTIAKKNVYDLATLWNDGKMPSCIDIYRKLVSVELFELPPRIDEVIEHENDGNDDNDKINALKQGLEAPYTELRAYWDYMNDNTQFATHQGIKGLEYDRVSVIMDDASAGGFLFSYEKLFGAKELSATDKKNIAEGKDSAISRTMRLFYVICTRAKDSLALIAYTGNVDAVKTTSISNKWFEADEIVTIDGNGNIWT
jgi:DNA helicase-2/ATP-dependent DNA helicase PcrA